MAADFTEVFRLAADLSKAGPIATLRAADAIAKTALDIERDAKMLAPVDTGYLRNSISVDVGGTAWGRLHAEIGPTAEYGVYVEYGTSRMAPQPYLGPAADRNGPLLEAAFAQIGGSIL